MIINTKTPLKTIEGGHYKENDQKDTTLGICIARELTVLKSTDPLKSFILAQDFYKKPEVDLSVEDIAFIKELLKSSNLFPFVIGQCLTLLDGKEVDIMDPETTAEVTPEETPAVETVEATPEEATA